VRDFEGSVVEKEQDDFEGSWRTVTVFLQSGD